MINRQESILERPGNTPQRADVGKKKTYRSPQLRCYGYIRDVTLGGSPGVGDSGGGSPEESL